MLSIKIDTSGAMSWLDEVANEQIPFATALAINRTADEALAGIKKSLPEHFTVRNQRLVDFLFKRTTAARKNNLVATIAVTGPKANIYGKHEDGGIFGASHEHPFFVPTAALRPSPQTVIPKAMYPAALRLVERRDVVGTLPAKSRRTRRGKIQIQGKRRTFVIDARETGTGMAWGVYERVGPGKHDIRLLWRYVSTLHLTPRLHFDDLADAIVAERWPINFAGFFDYAMRTAK